MKELILNYKKSLKDAKAFREKANESGCTESYEYFDGQVNVLRFVIEDLEDLEG